MKYILAIVTGLTLAQLAFTEDQANLTPRFFNIPADTVIRVRTKNESPVRQPMLVTTFKWKY
jgi:hypothetical protein